MIFETILDTIGFTPLVKLPVPLGSSRVLLKLEKTNPGQSMKDRMALSMVKRAMAEGRLEPGGTIVESSSGNTGTGLALIAAQMGFKFIAVVDHHAAQDKIRVMRAYGAEIRYVSQQSENQVATAEREQLARHLGATIPGACFMGQAENPANPEGYEDLAHDLLRDTRGHIDYLVGCVGTGGSLCGTAKFLTPSVPDLTVVGVEPVGSIVFGGEGGPYYQSGTGVPPSVEVGSNVDYDLLHVGRKVSDHAAFGTSRYIARRFGILVGGAAGGAIYESLQVARQHPGSTVVCLVCDGGEKYLDTIFNDEWLQARNLVSPHIDAELNALFNKPTSNAIVTP
ncbi:cysteine synthase [Gibbsiella quercinecans]|nr:cysteine synthase family protein [Gibbsiella quercinecans]RLM03810.1 cysteine synthase [Gibbsiella quercinecans]